jgi:chromosome segregation ATPase
MDQSAGNQERHEQALGREAGPMALDALERLESQLNRLRDAYAQQCDAAEARERELARQGDTVAHREAELASRERALREAQEAIRVRDEELRRIQVRLDGLRYAMRAIASEEGLRGADLETMIASAARQSAQAQRQAGETAEQLRALENRLEQEQDRARAAETAAAQLRTQLEIVKSERDDLRESLRQQTQRLRTAGIEIEWSEPHPTRKRRSA